MPEHRCLVLESGLIREIQHHSNPEHKRKAYILNKLQTKTVEQTNELTNSVALVRERTIPTERPPLVGEVSANFCGKRGVAWSVRRIPYGCNLGFLNRTSLVRSHKVLHYNTRTKYFTRTLAQSTSLEHSHKLLH
jgi:hypothetical protein